MPPQFFDPEADQSTYHHWSSRPAPGKTYFILFTPRSGSTWLNSLLTQTGAMGIPKEWFNPEHILIASRHCGARDLDQFVTAVTRSQAKGDVFGAEITYHQMTRLFGSPEAFLQRFPAAAFFFLIRRDIVAQAISMHKMVRTSVSHSAISDDATIAESDAAHEYDAEQIAWWVNRIRGAEAGIEAIIAAHGLQPVRLSYEQITRDGAETATRDFAAHLGVTLPQTVRLSSRHRKIGTDKNQAFAERFRAEQAELLRRVDQDRAALLALHP